MTLETRTDAPTVAAIIGGRVRAQRTACRWTLDQLADRSGVSRRMLINVEQGATNASIATLLRLSDALGLGLPALVDPGEVIPVQVRRSSERSPMWQSANGGSAVMLAGTDAPDVVELWDWTLGPEDAYESGAHSVGTRELLAVLRGVVHISVGTREETLRIGDSASFLSDRPHVYRNDSAKRSARFALTVFQPDVGVEVRP